jgi:ferredoxin-NADP reductase
MAGPPRKELYPSLMELPDLPPERRAEVEHLAHERMEAGTAFLSASLEKLAQATAAEDYAAMQEATAQVRQGLAQFESGLAAHRALAGGKGTREVALQWFKRSMNLLPAVEVETPHGIFGLSWFHYVTMFILTAFAVSMIWMYFHKMRRAEALLVKLAGGTGSVGDDATTAPSSPPSPGRVPPVPPASGPGLSPTPAPVHPAIAPSKSNSWSGPLRVARIFQETPQVKTFRLADPSGGTLPFSYLPGQFLTFAVTPDGQPVKRSYTIASSPTHRDACEVTVRREEQGVVSRYLHDRVHEGALLQLTAPSGKFTFTGQEADSIVLIAGGVGVTPFMSTIRYLTDRSWPGDIFLIYGCHEENDVIFREELEYLQRRYPNLHVTITATQADPSTWPYATGRITKELLAQSVPELVSRRVHICGPPSLMDAVKGMLTELGVPAERIQTETFIGKERPQAPPAAFDGAAPATIAVVTFARSHKTAVLPPQKTILEAAEDVGVNIDFSCRVGICGACRVKLLAGAVTMAVEDGLEPGDKAQHIILACQAKATNDVAVDV